MNRKDTELKIKHLHSEISDRETIIEVLEGKLERRDFKRKQKQRRKWLAKMSPIQAKMHNATRKMLLNIEKAMFGGGSEKSN